MIHLNCSAVGAGSVADSCAICLAELATVSISLQGSVKVGPKCARLLTAFVRLMGEEPKRKPMLRVLE
jgi:hypothetical protein